MSDPNESSSPPTQPPRRLLVGRADRRLRVGRCGATVATLEAGKVRGVKAKAG